MNSRQSKKLRRLARKSVAQQLRQDLVITVKPWFRLYLFWAKFRHHVLHWPIPLQRLRERSKHGVRVELDKDWRAAS